MQIRSARLDDAHAISATHQDSWREAYHDLLPAAYLRDLSAERLLPRWQERLSRPTVRNGTWVAESDGVVVGFVKAEPCAGDEALVGFAGEITMLYVHPTYQAAGVGRQLFAVARDSLASHPFFWLVVWVVEANMPARRFYDRMALTPDASRRIDQFPGAPVPVIRYAGPLNSIAESVNALQISIL